MSSFRLASRYAKSVLQLAIEKGRLQEVKSDILLLKSAFDGSRELRVMLKSPVIPADTKHTILRKLFGGKVDEITSKFIDLLVAKGRESFLADMTDSFIEQYNQMNGITKVKLTSASALDKATADSIINNLKTKENLKEISLEQTIDASLIGGFVLQYGDKQIDTSLKTSLLKLKHLVDDDSYVKKIR